MHQFNKNTQSRIFIQGDPVWLSIPTTGKLDPKWEGNWVIQSVRSPVTYTICDSRRTKTVHINRLRPRLQFNTDVNISTTDNQQPPHQPWKPPTVEHFIYTDISHYPRYPTRIRHPPDHYQP